VLLSKDAVDSVSNVQFGFVGIDVHIAGFKGSGVGQELIDRYYDRLGTVVSNRADLVARVVNVSACIIMRETVSPADQLPELRSIAQDGLYLTPRNLADLIHRFEVQRIIRGQRQYAVDQKQWKEKVSFRQGSRDNARIGKADLKFLQVNKGHLADVGLRHRQIGTADRRCCYEGVLEIHLVFSGMTARHLELRIGDSFFL